MPLHRVSFDGADIMTLSSAASSVYIPHQIEVQFGKRWRIRTMRRNYFVNAFLLLLFLCVVSSIPARQNSRTKPRARDLGVPFDGTPGTLNAITDVSGVTVGHTTLISGEGKLQIGVGPVRTGVTAILPRGPDSMSNPVFAGWFSQNGNGEMTGTTWVEESGF